MNTIDIPTKVNDLPAKVIDLVTDVMKEREDYTGAPVATADLPEPVLNLVQPVIKKLSNVAQLPQLVLDLPADVTQVDVARSLVELNHQNIRYNPEAQKWLVFNGQTGWSWDPLNHQVHQLVVETLRKLADTVPEGLDTTQHRRFTKTRRNRTRQMETGGAINSIINLASRESSIHCKSSEIDATPWVVGTPEGMVHLRSGKWIPYGPGWFITRRVPVTFNPNAACPRWERFLREVLGDDEEIQDYFHQLVGYIMSGDTSLQKMWLLVGNGSNGKSTLLHILQKVLGRDYAQQTPESVLLGRANLGGANNDLVRLKGVRCALLTETGYGQCFNEERVKALVAADTLAARGLYREFEEFTPQAKFLLATNHLPIVRGTDEGIWRRLVVVPFTREFEVGSDPTLKQDLVDELPGIFAWAIRGAVRWYDSNVPFTVPSAWDLVTSQYRTAQDPLKGFLDERVVFDAAAFVGATELYNDYVVWCRDDERQALSQSEFGQRMTTTDHVTKERKFKANRWHYIGVMLRCSDEVEVAAKLDGLFDGHSTTPPSQSLISQGQSS